MSGERNLYGHKIIPHHMLTYAEQVYDILLMEIQAGRWTPNERLPGVMQLARELNFGTKTVQSAYDRLKEEGYLHTLGQRGTFLRTLSPDAGNSSGTLGILIRALGVFGVASAAMDFYVSNNGTTNVGRFQLQQVAAGQEYDLTFMVPGNTPGPTPRRPTACLMIPGTATCWAP